MSTQSTGGLFYHYLAFRRGHKCWQTFRSRLQAWLQAWPTQSTHLVIIGASGGHCLPREFLERFDQITAIDLDPFAPLFFSMRHPRLNVNWLKSNFLTKNRAMDPAGLKLLRKRFPAAAILFNNVLGQVPLTVDCDTSQSPLRWGPWSRSLEKFTRDGEWASYHDLYSVQLSTPVRKELLLEKFGNPVKDLQRNFPNTPIVDHLTNSLFPTHNSRYVLPWQLDRKKLHLIEAVHQ